MATRLPPRRVTRPVSAAAAMLLELVPPTAAIALVAYTIGFIALNVATGFEPPVMVSWLAFLVLMLLSCVGGLGWMIAGRVPEACGIAVARSLLTLLGFIFAGGAVETSELSYVIGFCASVFGSSVLSLVSAIALGRELRDASLASR